MTKPAVLALLVTASAIAANEPRAARADEVAPVVLQRESQRTDDAVRLRVEVVDTSGPGTVTAYVRKAGETDYTPVPMNRASGNLFEVEVERPDNQDPWIVYYFEATDAAGNGPAANGSRAGPFVERFASGGAREVRPKLLTAKGIGVGSIVGGVLLLVLLLQLQRQRDRWREQAFWIERLGPLSALRGADLDLALEQFAARGHYHPVHGEIRVDAGTARRQLTLLARTHSSQLEAARQRDAARRAQAPQEAPRAANPLEGLEDELFWYRVLSPLLERKGPSLESELRSLAGRGLAHPKLGRRYFDVPTLRSRLASIREIDADDLLARAAAEGTYGADEPPRHPARGMTLIEMLVVLALVAVVIGVTLVSMMPLVAPVQRASEQVDGLMRQARASAMATIQVHRVRPLDEDSLIVETARSCSSGAWSFEDRMTLDLAGGVTLSDTAWSVCFDGRGLASNTVDLTLLHSTLPPQQLELMRGGLVRWI